MTKTQHECLYCGHIFIEEEPLYRYSWKEEITKCKKCGEAKQIKSKKIESKDVFGYDYKPKPSKNYY